ncbi:putative uncharacterized protein [Clostridium sp. CAG:354]|nr:putative uncharacterized protein [Clostridium sp. CAG:354]
MKRNFKNLAIITGLTIASLGIIALNNISFAFTENKAEISGDTLKRNFYVESNDEINFKTFINSDNNKTYQDEEGNTYTFQDVIATESDTNTKEVSDTKTINNLNTNDQQTILNQAGNTLSYDKDGYVGTLNYSNMNIQEVDTGTYERLLSLNIPFSGYSKNDLNNISKNITRNGRNWTLINVDWKPDSVQNIDGSQVPVTYSGTMHYQTVGVFSNPKQYNVTITYTGTVNKENPDYIYTATYKKEVPVEAPVEEKTNYTPIIITLSGAGIVLLIILFYFLSRNAKIYSKNSNGNYELIKKVHISSNNPKIDLSSLSNNNSKVSNGVIYISSPSNLYKVSLKDSLYNKISGKDLEIKLTNVSKKIRIVNKDIEFKI